MSSGTNPLDFFSLHERIFAAAKEGRPDDILSSLRGCGPATVQELMDNSDPSQSGHSPLTVAVTEGHTDVVEVLVRDLRVNTKQKIGPFKRNALYYAAMYGHVDIMKILVESGADVNEGDCFQRTPLHQACESGSLSAVRYLVEKGAEIDAVDMEGMSCVLICCLAKREEILRFLLEKGANPNLAPAFKYTPLHYSATRNDLRAIQLLLRHGATLPKNSKGQTLLVQAALQGSVSIVHIILESSAATKGEKVDAMEILGAVLVLWSDRHLGYSYLCKAMKERYRDPSNVLLKPNVTPIPGLGNVRESQTGKELESREGDPHSLIMECLLILARNLGADHPDLAGHVSQVCHYLTQNMYFHEAVTLYLHGVETGAMNLPEHPHQDITLTLFGLMLLRDDPPSFENVEKYLKLTVENLEQQAETRPNKSPQRQFEMRLIYSTCAGFLNVALEVARGKDDLNRLKNLVRRLLGLREKVGSSYSLLHFAVAECDDFDPCVLRVQNFPSPPLVSFLVLCRAEVDDVDHWGNTPLHLVARCVNVEDNLEALSAVTATLVEAGAHLDIRNCCGDTPLECVSAEKLEAVFRKHRPLPLRCLATKAVIAHNIPYEDQVPKLVQNFIQLHSGEKV